MSLQGEQLAAPPSPPITTSSRSCSASPTAATSSARPTARVAECGVGVVGAARRARRASSSATPVADVLVVGATTPSARAAFERLLRGERDDARRSAPRAPTARRARCSFVVVSVPLALGWEFTVAADRAAAPRRRHAGIPRSCACATSARSRPSRASVQTARSPTRAPASPASSSSSATSTRRRSRARTSTTHGRAARHRAAAREAERGRRGRRPLGPPSSTTTRRPTGPDLEDLVERAHVLRERVEDAEHDAAEATPSATRRSRGWPRSRPSATPPVAEAAQAE